MCAAPVARRWTGVLGAPLVLLSNGLFFLGFLPVLATSSVRWPPLVGQLQSRLERRWRPIIYMGWHAYSWCSYLVFRELPAALRPTSIAHDGVASRFNSRCGSWLGLDTLVYQRHAPTPPRQQIVDYALEYRRHLVLFPDSGGPYRVLKPGVVAVARAIVPEPALILADEPTGNLDPHLAIDILTLFEEINSTGTTVLFATHDHSLISKRDHRLISIDDGRVSEAQQGLKHWQGSSGIHTLVG